MGWSRNRPSPRRSPRPNAPSWRGQRKIPPGKKGRAAAESGEDAGGGQRASSGVAETAPGGLLEGGPSLTAARVPGSSGKVAVSTQVAGWVAAGAGVATGTGVVTGGVGSFLG